MTPFQRGQAVGNNVGQAFRNISDKSALDDILENAANTNDPNAIIDTMSQILNRVSDPQKRQEAAKMLEFKYKGLVEQKKQQKDSESKQRERQAKINMGVDPDLPNTLAKENIKKQRKDEEYQRTLDILNPQRSQQQQEAQPSSETQETNKYYSPEEKAALAFYNPAVERSISHSEDINRREATEEKKANQTVFQKDREYHTQFSKPVVEQAAKTLQIIPARKGLVNQWRRDISSGKTSGLGQYLVDRSGLEFWRNPESSRAKTAAKEYFIEGLSSLAPGTRPNQFIEQQLASALPTIGRDVESGLTVLEMQDFLDDLKEQYARNVVDLTEQDNEKYGYEKKDIGIRAQKMLDKYADDRQKELATRIRTIHEDQLDDKKLADELFLGGKVPQGTPLTNRVRSILMLKNNDDVNSAMREAIRLGYELK